MRTEQRELERLKGDEWKQARLVRRFLPVTHPADVDNENRRREWLLENGYAIDVLGYVHPPSDLHESDE